MSKYGPLVCDEIRENIEEYIRSNHLQPGTALPSERTMCELFDCNRVTLRKALTRMIGENILYSVQGMGTYVCQPKFVDDSSSKLISYSKIWQSQGYRTHNKVVEFKEAVANLKISQTMNLPLGTPVYILKRIRFVNEVPLALDICIIEKSRCPGLLNHNFNGNESLYRVLEEEYSLKICSQNQTIYTTTLREDEADYLNMTPGACAFHMLAVGMDENGDICERSSCISRADLYAIAYHATI